MGAEERRFGFRGAAMTLAICVAMLAHAGGVAAQTFSSGSSGVHGSFPPLPPGASQVPSGTAYMLWNMSTGLVRYCSDYDTTAMPETCKTEIANAQIPGIPPGGLRTGVFEFTDVNVVHAAYAWLYIYLVGNANNSPLTVLSQNQIHFSMYTQFFANGMAGTSTPSGLQSPLSLSGGRPGPGGFAGGASGFPGAVATDGDPGFGPSGGTGGFASGSCYYTQPYTWGSSASAPLSSLVPLLGGSGGGGGAATLTCGIGHNNGAGGGGGAGAVLMIATTQINFESPMYLYLTGGDGGASYCYCYGGGAGAGGTLRLVAPTLISSGMYGYFAGGYGAYNPYFGYSRGAGGYFRIEGDATQFSFYPYGQSDGSISPTPGSVVPAGTPTLRITQVGDLTVPVAPSGNTNTPDITFQTAPTGPVSVALAGSNIPPGTVAKVRVTPQIGAYQEVMSSALAGTASSTTAAATVTIPPGFGAITASATFTCDGTICALLKPSDRANAVVEVVADNKGSHAWIRKADGTRIALPTVD